MRGRLHATEVNAIHVVRVQFGGEGETTLAIWRRLSAAAEVLGTSLNVRRMANAVYFWGAERRRRGRPRRKPVE